MHLAEVGGWVAEKNTREPCGDGGGWGDYVEWVGGFGHKFDIPDVRAGGHYVVRTPPPEEELPMPAVGLTKGSVLVFLQWDFGAARSWPREWTLSVRRPSPYLAPTFDLFDPAFDLCREPVDVLSPDLAFGPRLENHR